MNYRGKTALVVGAGRTGIAAARFLLALQARVILTDIQERKDLQDSLAPVLETALQSGELKLELGGHRHESFANCDFVVASPGIPLMLPYFETSRKAGIPILAEVELAFRHLKGTVIAITGTNGKTTTTMLVSHLLARAGMKAYAAGNIGAPLIDFAADSTPESVYAVELSSFQLEGIHEFRPFIGAILNLAPDHMDRYSRFEDYVSAKSRILMNQGRTDYAVLNADDPATAAMRTKVRARPVLFSRTQTPAEGAFIRNGRAVFRKEAKETDLFPVSAVGLPGPHNLENVLAACAMSILAGAPTESLEESIRAFKGVEHRIEFVLEMDGVRYFNDSKATNVASAAKSLESFSGNVHLIAGGRDKEGDFTVLKSLVRERVKQLVLIGEAAEKIRKALAGTTVIRKAQTIEEAVQLCSRLAERGDVVLLAPACASFDMFKDYEHRGRAFKEAVFGMRNRSGFNADYS